MTKAREQHLRNFAKRFSALNNLIADEPAVGLKWAARLEKVLKRGGNTPQPRRRFDPPARIC
jgi:hypothetical protein